MPTVPKLRNSRSTTRGIWKCSINGQLPRKTSPLGGFRLKGLSVFIIGNPFSSSCSCTNTESSVLKELPLKSQKFILEKYWVSSALSLCLEYRSNGMVESTSYPSDSILPFLNRNRMGYCWAPGCKVRLHISSPPLWLQWQVLTLKYWVCSLFPYLHAREDMEMPEYDLVEQKELLSFSKWLSGTAWPSYPLTYYVQEK